MAEIGMFECTGNCHSHGSRMNVLKHRISFEPCLLVNGSEACNL